MNIGDIMKVNGENIVFRIKGFSKGRKAIPDGWPICDDNVIHNPDKCSVYTGAMSCMHFECYWDRD